MALISAHLNAGVIVVVTLSVAVCCLPFPHLLGSHLNAGVIVVVTLSVAVCCLPFPHLLGSHLNAGVIAVVTLSVAVCCLPFPHLLGSRSPPLPLWKQLGVKLVQPKNTTNTQTVCINLATDTTHMHRTTTDAQTVFALNWQ